MGKIVMPKNSALLNEIESVLQIYYEADDWLPNEEYKTKLKQMIGDDQYASSYTKKSQITSYFGFTEWEDINNTHSRRRITNSGRRMYEAIKAENKNDIQEVLMNALETVKFGRDNYGCPESSSDIEPPSLYVRAILDMGYLTYREFAFLLWKLEDLGANYSDVIEELKNIRSEGTLDLGEEANKYADCKPIMILVRWGFLSEDESKTSGGKHIVIAPEVLAKYEKRLRNLKIYNVDMSIDDESTIGIEDIEKTRIIDIQRKEQLRVSTGENILLYGVPGSGKSWTIQHEYCNDEECMERLVFHPDYMYSDFVGQILPVVKTDEEGNEKVRYEFKPGPFTKILKKAYETPEKSFYLVIEEINRGNAPAIFGEIFQLLDRMDEDKDGFKKGSSEYGITNENIALAVYGDSEAKVRIPANLSILGTMNTSDQNVFTLDTAFQRRWVMRMIKNSFEKHRYADKHILDTTVSWKQFCEAINYEILKLNNVTSSEDKRLGAYFVSADNLVYVLAEDGATEKQIIDTEHKNAQFAEKVLKYLWDDAFKFAHPDTFDMRRFQSLEMVIETFNTSRGNNRFDVFHENLRKLIIEGINENNTVSEEDN